MKKTIVGWTVACSLALGAESGEMTLEIAGKPVAAFGRAQAVLRTCRKEASPACPVWGFRVPFFAPGGAYGANWWQLDHSVAVQGVKWYDSADAARGLDGFADVMRPDGRIPLYGNDTIPRQKGWFSEQSEGVSSLPAFFRAAHAVAVWRGDRAFARRMADLAFRYLNWWQKQRVNAETGLVTAVFEETFPPYLGWAGEVADPGTCAEVAHGAELTADLFARLGDAVREAACRETARRLFAAARSRLWNAKAAEFCPLDLRVNAFQPSHALGFSLLQDCDLPRDVAKAARETALGVRYFGSGACGLTSVARDDARFKVTRTASYQGNDSWNGMVWTLINLRVADGFAAGGFAADAKSLALRTVAMLEKEDDFYEFYDPTDGKGCGVKGYAWTAADYLELVLRHLLGITYDGFAKRLEVRPGITNDFCVTGLDLPGKGRATVRQVAGKVRVTVAETPAAPQREIAWPPVEARALADAQGLLLPSMRDGGETKRAYEIYAHGLRPEWRYRVSAQTNFVAVVPPKAGHRKGAPLVVLLHSAGCRLADGSCTRGTGPNHMGGTFRKGDCCVYSIPDDFYAVFPDCGVLAGEDWWWGGECKTGAGFDLSPCERRVLDEIEWVVRMRGIDRNRIYLAGNSMGGSGALGLGLRHGDIFAAVKANVPAGVEHALARIGWGTDDAAAARLPDPPVTVDYSAPNDSWSKGHEKLAAALSARKYPYHLFWGSFGHCGENAVVRRYNDIYSGIDWLSVCRNEAYPVFTRASTDDALPWPCDSKASDALPPGQVNGYFRWTNRADAPDRFEMDLRLVSAQEAASKIFTIPAEATADLTLRRIQRFTLAPGETVRWSYGGKGGTAVADATGRLTLAGLRFTTAPQRLSLTRWHPVTQETFTLGADVSWITEMERKGLTLRDREGREKDCFALLRDYGLSAVRLRVWVDPSKRGNWCAAGDVLAKALRAQRAGHEVMVDFHYSDWWADPGKQNMPAAWSGLSREAVIAALARHTEDVLTLLRTNGVSVKWVQVGNETDHGILWKFRPDKNGKVAYVRQPNGVWSPDMTDDSFADRYRHPENYAACIRAGYGAVKRVYPRATVIVHHAEGCNVASVDDHLATLAAHGAPWDMLGISLYPYHSRYRNPVEQKTIDEALASLRHVAEKWRCDTMVVETGFECIPEKYAEGRDRLAEVVRRARATPRCRGVLYWEPQCRPGHFRYPLGAFDDEGRPTPIMDGFL